MRTSIETSILRGITIGLHAGETRFCAQCHRHRAFAQFVSERGRARAWCNQCTRRYKGWDTKTPAQRLRARRRVKRTGNGYTVFLSLKSANRKTGPIPVSITDMKSCPTSCPLIDAGCYASYGKVGWHWKTVPERGVSWLAFCAQVAALPIGTLWRHNEAGDLPGVGDTLDRAALRALARANRGRRGFRFSHKPLRDPDDRRAVAEAVADGFMINLSANNLAEADALADLGIAPVAVILPSETRAATRTPAGRKVVVCPAVTSGLTCATCGLCAKEREAVIGFPTHGQAAALVPLRLSARR